MATAAVLPILAAPYSPISSLYPSSPLAEFPPPVPTLRRPLRERCGFTHNLKIHTSFAQQARPGPWSPKGHIQPHRNHLPRRRKGQIKRIVLYEDDSATEPKVQEGPEALNALPETEGRHLQEVVPGLFLEFRPADSSVDIARAQEERYTHVIDICYPPPGYDSGAVEQAYESRLQRLRLVLPSTSRPTDSQRAGLALTDAQLRMARDFLAQTLPYSGVCASQVASQTVPHAVRILLSTPARRPTDAMSIAGCYLSFASGKSVETALRFIDDEDNFLSVWKGEVSEDEIAKVERVARMWSWLSSIRR